jgi:hypothetical protein
MRMTYTEEDVHDAPSGHLPLVGTDLELCFTRSGNDAVLHVNKGGVMICRIRLQDAGRDLSAEALMQFSTSAPDFMFKVGDSREGMERLKRSLGVA